MLPHRSHSKGVIMILAASLLLGSYGVWSRLMGTAFDAFSQAWIRAIMILLVLTPIVFYKKSIQPLAKKDWKWFGIFFLSPLLSQAPTYYAFNHMDIGTATLLLFVSLLLTMYIVGFVVLKEKISIDKCVSLVIALIGLILIFSFSLEKFSLFAALMAILVGVVSGLQVSISKKVSGSYSPLYLTYIGWLVVVPANLLGTMIVGSMNIPPFTHPAWLYLVGFAGVGLISAWLYLEGMRHIEASIGALIGLLEIIFGIGFGMLLFGETLTFRIFLGAVLVMVAAGLPNVWALRLRLK